MAYGKPKLKDGVVPFLIATQEENNGMTAARFLEVMSYNIAMQMKVSTIRKESQRATNTVKSYIRQWESEQ
jgi:hypothetical protein